MKKVIILTASLILAIGMLCSCGGSDTSDDSAVTEATTAEKATVTAGEAAAKEQTKETQKVKTGTEDGAIDAAKAKAAADIKGFDGNWENVEVEVDDPTTIIDFDYGGKHYSYTFDQESGKIVE